MSKRTPGRGPGATATITSKGQVTVPARVREALHVSAGDELRFEPAGPDTMKVLVRRRPTVTEVAGRLASGSRADDLRTLQRDAYRARGQGLKRTLGR